MREIVERREIGVRHTAQQQQPVGDAQLPGQRFNLPAPLPGAHDGVLHIRLRAGQVRQGAQHGVDPLVRGESRDGQEPARSGIQPVPGTHDIGRHAGPEEGGIGAEGHGANAAIGHLELELPKDREAEPTRPLAVRDQHARGAEQRPRGAPLHRGAMHLMLQHQQVGSVEQDAERRADPFVGPFGGIAPGSDLAAPDETGLVRAGELRDAAGPEQQALKAAEPARGNRQAIHLARERFVHLLAVRMLPGGNDDPRLGIAGSDLRHPAGQAAAHGGKTGGEEQIRAAGNRARHARLGVSRAMGSTTSSGDTPPCRKAPR